MDVSKRIAAIVAGCALMGAMSAPVALAGPPAKCNSGNGNGSETDPASDCDPGKSGGHNNGGD